MFGVNFSDTCGRSVMESWITASILNLIKTCLANFACRAQKSAVDCKKSWKLSKWQKINVCKLNFIISKGELCGDKTKSRRVELFYLHTKTLFSSEEKLSFLCHSKGYVTISTRALTEVFFVDVWNTTIKFRSILVMAQECNHSDSLIHFTQPLTLVLIEFLLLLVHRNFAILCT